MKTTPLRTGHSRSCGCLARELASIRHTTHGHTRNTPTEHNAQSPTYRSWQAAIWRCEDPHNSHYAYYGGRGIRMCEGWRRDFGAFLRDMGERPNGLTLDRYPNNDGNYEPGNCRWATNVEQQANRRPYTTRACTCQTCGVTFVAARRNAYTCSRRCRDRRRTLRRAAA